MLKSELKYFLKQNWLHLIEKNELFEKYIYLYFVLSAFYLKLLHNQQLLKIKSTNKKYNSFLNFWDYKYFLTLIWNYKGIFFRNKYTLIQINYFLMSIYTLFFPSRVFIVNLLNWIIKNFLHSFLNMKTKWLNYLGNVWTTHFLAKVALTVGKFLVTFEKCFFKWRLMSLLLGNFSKKWLIIPKIDHIVLVVRNWYTSETMSWKLSIRWWFNWCTPSYTNRIVSQPISASFTDKKSQNSQLYLSTFATN